MYDTGKKFLEFPSMTEFMSWKEREEDATYTAYVKSQQTYNPQLSGTVYDYINHDMSNLLKFPNHRS